ncbi:MAG: hypothetical protein WCA46_15950 [Actinocatenispora sp.]
MGTAEDRIGPQVRELYQLPLEEFLPARDRMVRETRAAGDRDLADELGAVRKPQLAAWLVNRLGSTEPERLAEFLDLADAFRVAYAAGDARQLRNLTAERQRRLARLVDRVRAIAVEAGKRPGDAVLGQVEETLAASLADPDVGRDARAGTLRAPTSYSGLGPMLPTGEAAPAGTRGGTGTGRRSTEETSAGGTAPGRKAPGRKTGTAAAGGKSSARTAPAGKAAGGKARTGQRDRKAAGGSRRTADQREQGGDSAATRAEQRRQAALTQAREARDTAGDEEREARDRLAELDGRLTELRDTMRGTMRERDRCHRRHESLQRALARAEKRLAALDDKRS